MVRRFLKPLMCIGVAIGMTACATSNGASVRHGKTAESVNTKTPELTPRGSTKLTLSEIADIPGLRVGLRDVSSFHQQDPRWASTTIGGSNEPIETDGCLVTATAMAMANLGFQTNPGDLATRLKKNKGFTSQGWLIWSGLGKVSGGKAQTRFFKTADAGHVRQCLDDGYYPLVKFKLKSRRSHWAVVIAEGEKEFYVRDPMISSSVPIPLSSRADGITSVRCVGVG